MEWNGMICDKATIVLELGSTRLQYLGTSNDGACCWVCVSTLPCRSEQKPWWQAPKTCQHTAYCRARSAMLWVIDLLLRVPL